MPDAEIQPLRVVVVLGAGASAPFGVPTLRHVFTEVRARQHLNNDEFLYSNLRNVFWSPRGLTLNSSPDGPTVEDILTILGDSERQTILPVLLGGEADRFRHNLYVLIKKAIFDGRSSKGEHLNALIEFFSQAAVTEVTWASFNWDCLFESSFYYNSAPVGGIRRNPKVPVPIVGWKSPPGSSKHTYLKLHGGVNWWFEESKLRYLSWGGSNELDTKWAAYEKNETPGHPVLLEPSFYKYEDALYELVHPQWEYFVERVAQAHCVVVVGYSLPEADAKARSALSLGFQANPGAKWYIVNPDEGVCDRYRRILGSKVLSVFPAKLEEFTPHLADVIGTDFPALKPPPPAAEPSTK